MRKTEIGGLKRKLYLIDTPVQGSCMEWNYGVGREGRRGNRKGTEKTPENSSRIKYQYPRIHMENGV